MQFDRAGLAELLSESARAPRSAARRLMALEPGMELALPAMVATSCLSALLTSLMFMVLPIPPEMGMSALFSQPFLLAAMQGLGLMILAALVTGIGRVFGGRGRLAEALFLLSWVDAVLLVAEIGLSVLTFVLPGPGALFSLAVLAFSVWLAAGFIAELHGFASTRGVVLGLIGFFLLFFAALSAIAPPM